MLNRLILELDSRVYLLLNSFLREMGCFHAENSLAPSNNPVGIFLKKERKIILVVIEILYSDRQTSF